MKLQSIFSRAIVLTMTITIIVSCQDDINENPITIKGSESELKTIYLGQDIFQYEEYPDGTNIIEGDIILPNSLILKLKEIAEDPNGSIDDLKESSQVNLTNGRVSGLGEPTTSPFSGGVVYFYIDSDVSNKTRIYDAINAWESATVLDFTELSSPGSNTSSNWIHFKSSTSGCSSTIANFQTLNVVRLSSGCTVNNIKHEIGHAIGLFHEHQRIDRDDHLEIFWSNIPEDRRNNYRLLNTLIYSFTLGDGNAAFSEGGFDFNSIMIYNTFQTINGSQASVLVKKSDGSQIVKTGDITATDAATVNRLINDDIDEKLMFSPFDIVIGGSKGSNQFTLNWDHVGSIQGLSSPPNEFWLFKIDPGSNDEWILDRKIIGGSTRNHSLNLNWRNPPRYRLAAINSTNGAFSTSDEAVYDFTGNCSCTDDFEMIDAVYIEDSQDFYYYQVGWTETPSGYSTVELGYTDNSGSKIVLKNDFNGCETGWEWFYLPCQTKLDGPASFWLRASTGSYVRHCNGNLSTGSFQSK